MTIDLPLAVATDHPAFAGHFPSTPVVPGVVLLDHSLRSIATHLGCTSDPRWRIANVKFLSPVRPGEPLALEVATPGDAAVHDAARVALTIRAGVAPEVRIAMTGQLARDCGDTKANA